MVRRWRRFHEEQKGGGADTIGNCVDCERAGRRGGRMANLEGLIERLLEGRKNRGKRIQLSEPEIRQLCAAAKKAFLSQPNLLELEAPINICGNPLLSVY